MPEQTLVCPRTAASPHTHSLLVPTTPLQTDDRISVASRTLLEWEADADLRAAKEAIIGKMTPGEKERAHDERLADNAKGWLRLARAKAQGPPDDVIRDWALELYALQQRVATVKVPEEVAERRRQEIRHGQSWDVMLRDT